MENPNKESPKRVPLFIPRKNGSGWDLNMEHSWASKIWIIVLAIPFAVGIICLFIIKNK